MACLSHFYAHNFLAIKICLRNKFVLKESLYIDIAAYILSLCNHQCANILPYCARVPLTLKYVQSVKVSS